MEEVVTQSVGDKKRFLNHLRLLMV